MDANKKQQYIDRLKQLQGQGDTEYNHSEADDILCEILKELGYEDIVTEYELIDKWFA